MAACRQGRVPTAAGSMLELLGGGGYGQVFLAQHTLVPGLRVAIKLLNPELLQRPDIATRFRIEAAAIGKLEHPGVVKLREFGQAEGFAYLVMDYLEGRTLRDWLDAQQGPGAARRTGVLLLRQVASALRAAHQAGIVHRDLKPDNVMVVADPAGPSGLAARVVDFGVAKLAEEHFGSLAKKAQTGGPIGTAAYMAPEQWRVSRLRPPRHPRRLPRLSSCEVLTLIPFTLLPFSVMKDSHSPPSPLPPGEAAREAGGEGRRSRAAAVPPHPTPAASASPQPEAEAATAAERLSFITRRTP